MDGIKKAVVTGASSGIGRAITAALIDQGYEVYALGRSFTDGKCDDRLHKRVIDLLDTDALEQLAKEMNNSGDISLLVNAAGVGYYGLHESLGTHEIQTMIRTNVEVPVVLTGLLLKMLKKNNGCVVNISSHTANQANPHGCAYGATKAALSSFSKSLFAEERKYGLRVVNIEPDMTKTALYRNADFDVAADEDAYLLPEEVAQAVMYALDSRPGCILTDIKLEPKINRIARKDRNR